ncbi:response regulator [Mucilaginibacter gotjawali]|uniref:Transcriptional activator protein CzcR n=2 Tax=Mucilaginibacter gotjawali TaxID=1550579 RepID=A0A0X8X7X2_9SPHI|nr:response regulator [Mucilaginibacter gotjawali]MBB3056368.1 CheY-like chemotaxis protein [Mucilaginibacter gotjawali]BAU55074.1 Transcriptional activator protein CzcR [Mucilaginibacter gotjawali]
MILLIEDNNDIRESFEELLVLEGFAVKTASNGFDALKMVQNFIPKLVICDILMPGMDGYDVITAFKKNVVTRNIPFIFSSSKSESADAAKAEKLGARYFLVKPFGEPELMACINDCLQK